MGWNAIFVKNSELSEIRQDQTLPWIVDCLRESEKNEMQGGLIYVADIKTKESRSYNMSRIAGKDTKPEELVRKYLFSKGFPIPKKCKETSGDS